MEMARGNKFVNCVFSYGAKGDGYTDDTAAISAYIKACVESGEAIRFPNNTFRISEEIELQGGDA